MSTSTPSGKSFDVNVSGLTRHLFFDTIIIALTSFVIGLPALSTIYNYYSNVLGSTFPRIKCYPPSNINVSTADIEYFCLSHYSLYATFYPGMATVFGVLITAVFYIWINNNSSMFDLFYSWAKKMEKSNDPHQNLTITKKIENVIDAGNSMYISYVVMKVFQAIFALVAFLITIMLLFVSPFDFSSIFKYELIFYCQVDHRELLNSPVLSSVPCTAISLRTTVGTLYINLVLLFLIFVCSILSVFPNLFIRVQNHKLFEHDEQAVLFSFHTGLSPHLYQSESRAHLAQIRKNLEFLKLFLLRTNSELANKIWETEMFDRIELNINQDLMMSISNYKRYFVDSAVLGTGPFQFPSDLVAEGLEEVLKTQKLTKKYDQGLKLKLPQFFRGAVIRYCSAAVGKGSKAVYIAFDPNSLGIPLALSFVFQNVYVVSFDPSRKVEGSTTDDLCRKKKHYNNFQQLIFPHDILASEPSNWTTITDSFEDVQLNGIHCIVFGPIEDKPSQIMNLILMLDTINKDPGCILLVIAPVEGKYVTNRTLKPNHLHGDLIPKWESLPVHVSEIRNNLPWSWPEKAARQEYGIIDPEINEGKCAFKFHLYHLKLT